MWDDLVGPLLIGSLLAYIGHLITRGSRRWRALEHARTELEVAELLDADAELAKRLRANADDRIGRYLDPRGLETDEGKARAIVAVVATLTVLIGLTQILDQVDPEPNSFWAQLAYGGGGALAWHALYWGLQPVVVKALRARD